MKPRGTVPHCSTPSCSKADLSRSREEKSTKRRVPRGSIKGDRSQSGIESIHLSVNCFRVPLVSRSISLLAFHDNMTRRNSAFVYIKTFGRIPTRGSTCQDKKKIAGLHHNDHTHQTKPEFHLTNHEQICVNTISSSLLKEGYIGLTYPSWHRWPAQMMSRTSSSPSGRWPC